MLTASHFSFLDYSLLPLSGSGDAEEQDLPASQGMLTDRQEAIAQLVAQGLTCDSIADELQVPVRAVEGHVYRILEILGLPTMKDLTEGALERFRAGIDGRIGTRSEPLVSELLTVAEIAMSMRVSKMTVYRLIQSGALGSVRFGRSYRVTQAAMQHYLDSTNSTLGNSATRSAALP